MLPIFYLLAGLLSTWRARTGRLYSHGRRNIAMLVKGQRGSTSESIRSFVEATETIRSFVEATETIANVPETLSSIKPVLPLERMELLPPLIILKQFLMPR